jgi:predicted RNA polymerase sigma factor
VGTPRDPAHQGLFVSKVRTGTGHDHIRQRSVLEGNHLYHAMRGTFAAELGQTAAAVAHFRQAASLALLPVERDFISRRIKECEAARHL